MGEEVRGIVAISSNFEKVGGGMKNGLSQKLFEMKQGKFGPSNYHARPKPMDESDISFSEMKNAGAEDGVDSNYIDRTFNSGAFTSAQTLKTNNNLDNSNVGATSVSTTSLQAGSNNLRPPLTNSSSVAATNEVAASPSAQSPRSMARGAAESNGGGIDEALRNNSNAFNKKNMLQLPKSDN